MPNTISSKIRQPRMSPQKMPYRRCPDGSIVSDGRMCPPRRAMPSRKTSMSRAEQFKKERLGK